MADARRFVRQRPRGRKRVTHRRLFDIGCDDADHAEFRAHLGKHRDAWTVDTVIVRHEYSHELHARCKAAATTTAGAVLGEALLVKVTLLFNPNAGDKVPLDRIREALAHHG